MWFHTCQPGCPGTHTSYPISSQFLSSSWTCRRRGRKATSLSLDKRQGHKAHSSQRTDPDILSPAGTFGSKHSVSAFVWYSLLCFLNWLWALGAAAAATTCKVASPSCLGHPTSWTKLMMSPFAQPTASQHATTSPNCSNTLSTSYNEMLSRSKLERQLDFHMLNL